MSFTPDETAKYRLMASAHADFLCDEVFRPAFVIAFIHGAKHMKEDMMSGACDAKKPLSNPNWNEPDIIEKQRSSLASAVAERAKKDGQLS